jgi:succinate dehydrogenase / fumarate reductase cytochrome b subunit
MAELSDKDRAKNRPVFRNIHITQILRYRLPWAGKVSILHRVSGALLFLALPVLLLPLFELSLSSEISYDRFREVVGQWWVKLILFVLLWGYLHHFCAGLRYLLLDVHVGTEKESAQKSAMVVLAVSLGLTLLLGLKFFGVF